MTKLFLFDLHLPNLSELVNILIIFMFHIHNDVIYRLRKDKQD